MAAEREDMTQYDWFSRARGHESNGEYDEALEAYDKAIELDIGFEKAYYYKARLLHQLERHDEGKKAARKVMELKPDWEKHVKKLYPDL